MSDDAPARLLIVFNPNAGQRRRIRLERALTVFREAGARVSVVETQARGDGIRLAETAEAGWGAIVAAGGDGTANEVANGLMARAETGAAEKPALGIIPLGSANVAAREFGMPLDPAKAAKRLLAAPRRRISLGLVEAGALRRHFIQMAGVGFDARLVERVTPRLKKRLGRGAYAWVMLQEWLSPHETLFDVRVDGIDSRASSLIACKGHFYGGGFVLVPEARPTDPHLHVCLYRRLGRWPLVRDTVVSAFGSLARTDGIDVVRGREVSINGPDAPVQIDGETVARVPARLSVVPDALDALLWGGHP